MAAMGLYLESLSRPWAAPTAASLGFCPLSPAVWTGDMVDSCSETWWTGHASDLPALTVRVAMSIRAIR